jgi:hypothetical protein
MRKLGRKFQVYLSAIILLVSLNFDSAIALENYPQMQFDSSKSSRNFPTDSTQLQEPIPEDQLSEPGNSQELVPKPLESTGITQPLPSPTNSLTSSLFNSESNIDSKIDLVTKSLVNGVEIKWSYFNIPYENIKEIISKIL